MLGIIYVPLDNTVCIDAGYYIYVPLDNTVCIYAGYSEHEYGGGDEHNVEAGQPDEDAVDGVLHLGPTK